MSKKEKLREHLTQINGGERRQDNGDVGNGRRS